MDVLGILGTVVGAISGAIAIYLFVRNREWRRGNLQFEIGLTNAVRASDSDASAQPKNVRVGNLYYGTPVNLTHEIFALLYVTLANPTKIAVEDVRLLLQYPEVYGVRDFGFIEQLGIGLSLQEVKERDIQIGGGIASVSYDIPVVRPGEKIGIVDPICFSRKAIGKWSSPMGEISGELGNRLCKIERFGSYFLLHAFLYSKNGAHEERRVNVLWFFADNLEQLGDRALEAVRAFWGGEFLKPGVYMNISPLRPLLREQAAEFSVPKLLPGRLPSGKVCSVELPMKGAWTSGTASMPGWDYHRGTRPPVEDFTVPSLSKVFPTFDRVFRSSPRTTHSSSSDKQ